MRLLAITCDPQGVEVALAQWPQALDAGADTGAMPNALDPSPTQVLRVRRHGSVTVSDLTLALVQEVLGNLAALTGTAQSASAAVQGAALIDGLVFNAGPGGFTAIRGACAMAQGLALGWGKPLAAVSSLEAWAEPVLHRPIATADATEALVLVLLDARMGECYAGLFRRIVAGPGLRLDALAQAVLAPAQIDEWLRAHAGLVALRGPRLLLGDFSAAHPQTLAALTGQGWQWHAAGALNALDLLRIAHRERGQRFREASLAAPMYVRDKVALNAGEQQALRERNSAGRA